MNIYTAIVAVLLWALLIGSYAIENGVAQESPAICGKCIDPGDYQACYEREGGCLNDNCAPECCAKANDRCCCIHVLECTCPPKEPEDPTGTP